MKERNSKTFMKNKLQTQNKEESNLLPKEWDVKKFEDCLSKEKFKVGKVKQQIFKHSGKYPIVDQGQKLIAGYWDNEEDVYSGNLPVIIFGDHTRISKYIDFRFVCGADGTKVILPDKSFIYPKYLYYAILNKDIPSRGYNRHYSLLKDKEILIPSLPEQQKISYVLSTIQEAKEKTQISINSLKELKKSTMKHLFTYGAVSFDDVEKIKLKNTEIGAIPQNWDMVSLGKIAKVKYGKGNPKKEGNVPVVGSSGIYAWTDEPLINAPTLIIGRKGTAGEIHLFSKPCYPSDTTFYLIIDFKKVNISFLYYFMKSHKLSGDHAKTTVPSIQRPDLENQEISIPSMPEQQQIASILSSIDTKIQAEENRKEAIEQLFKSLLHTLMSGKIRVNNLKIEVKNV
jgi:type I restriction enzyme, S subunit